uniref:Dicarboxylate/amino acid:cation (Na or H ) symporter (DAACS) family protein putative n=1 Tax=Albugo laibachii Nc14 TaxID=890382 RepID=F0W0H1_9STRA|nr:dicarboxylate/amino acid:cation (Na or H) symporter (DAACS) family protein putative [Albugo laibachii Nc14]|eukprot:CCA14543.1 dicarboxylate/amino acid:cation (Na or H) symporter (DAACS) family protein putative [Albugo laibachii Nc14]
MNRLQYVEKKNFDKLRESLWKNAAVGTFFLLGYHTSASKNWWMNPDGLFSDWPHGTPESIRWYYRIYFSYWLQSIDFLLNVTNRHYIVKRRDHTEMIIHHLTTMTLMMSSYVFDFTRIGLCALMIHDVCDLLLETAKMLVYMSYVNAANVVFAVFAIAWYVLRLGVYPSYIISPAYTNMYDAVMHSPLEESKRYWVWFGNVALLAVVLVLNIYWASLITKMVLVGLGSQRLNKDIRSDSEEESVEMQEKLTPGSGDQSAERMAEIWNAKVTASTYKRRLDKNTRTDEQCTKVN